ncbi:hypothetical protein EDB87DRAFT_392965 [Lactarius vividus]|nr:hypothetical protein EDB87DRAFT_392965 [Lactarius vividus]
MALVGSRPRRNLREASYSRDSNTLRASVLDAALELGIGTSRAVENLIFNTVDEEDDADVRIPFSTFALLPPPFFFFLSPPFSFSFLRPPSSRTATEHPLLRIEQKLSHFDKLSSSGDLAVVLLHLYVAYGKHPVRAKRVFGSEIASLRKAWGITPFGDP